MVEHVDHERPLGPAGLGGSLLPARAPRAEELRHELGLEPRAHDPAPPPLPGDRARDRAADGAGDLQRVDQRRAQQDGAKIAAAQKEIAAAQARETRLQQQVTNSRFLADCEAGLQSCSQTHKLGRGPYYRRDTRRAAAAAAELERARPEIAATIAANRQKIAGWRAAERSQIATRVATIKANRDFLARQAALDRVQKASPAVTKYVQFFLAFLIAIDLVALMLKLTHLFSTGGAYERAAAALRANDLVDVHRLQQRANVLTNRITLQARAQQEADELRIGGDVSREPDVESDELRLDERQGRRPSLGGPATATPLGD